MSTVKCWIFLIIGFLLGSLFTIGCGHSGGGSGGFSPEPTLANASDISFDNLACGLASTNVQRALEEILTNHHSAQTMQGVEAMATTSSTLTGAINELVNRAATLEAELAALETKTASMSLSGTDLVFSSVNINLTNGTGNTETVNGLGNLTIGYAESTVSDPDAGRGGSHCVVNGVKNFYLSYGSVIFGRLNSSEGPYCSIFGGTDHICGGTTSNTICGGSHNFTSGTCCSVSGSSSAQAAGSQSVASGDDVHVNGTYFHRP